MKLPILYHLGKNGTVQWKVWTEDDRIFTEFGLVDGKKQQTSKLAKPKNIGRSNETSGKEQAILEAKSMHTHRLERKYSLSPKQAQKTIYLPMLALNFEDEKHKVKYPVLVQPKLNGVRCMARHIDGELKLFSRSGKEYIAPHIAEQINLILPNHMILDGEIYKHGTPLEDINSLVKDNRAESSKLRYYAYDLYNPDHPEMTANERLTDLADIAKDKDWKLPLTLVSHTVANDEGQVYSIQKFYRSDGYEGAIVRLPDGVYELANRSHSLLKVKNFLDGEFRIVGHYFGKGRAEKCITWVCTQEEGKEFSVVPEGTIEQKEKWGREAKKYYGKMLKVRFRDRTKENIPYHAVGECIRLDEDMST